MMIMKKEEKKNTVFWKAGSKLFAAQYNCKKDEGQTEQEKNREIKRWEKSIARRNRKRRQLGLGGIMKRKETIRTARNNEKEND